MSDLTEGGLRHLPGVNIGLPRGRDGRSARGADRVRRFRRSPPAWPPIKKSISDALDHFGCLGCMNHRPVVVVTEYGGHARRDAEPAGTSDQTGEPLFEDHLVWSIMYIMLSKQYGYPDENCHEVDQGFCREVSVAYCSGVLAERGRWWPRESSARCDRAIPVQGPRTPAPAIPRQHCEAAAIRYPRRTMWPGLPLSHPADR
jgi:hypothetical protein